MFKTIDPQNNIYKITIEYQEKEYTYKASLIQSFAGEERWHIYTKSRMLIFIYNTALKELREDLIHGQPPIPKDFMEVLKEAFRNKK